MHREPSNHLISTVTRYRDAEADLLAARDEMYTAIRTNLADGVRQAEIVHATGLTRERIRQITNADTTPTDSHKEH